MPDIITMFQVLNDTPIPAIMLVAGCIFLFIAIVGRFAWDIIIEKTWQRVVAALLGLVLVLFSVGIYAAPGPNGPSESSSNGANSVTNPDSDEAPDDNSASAEASDNESEAAQASDNESEAAQASADNSSSSDTSETDPPTYSSLEDDLRARSFAGTSITAYLSPESVNETLFEEFEELSGIEVEIIEASSDPAQVFDEQMRYFEIGSSEFDVTQIDVIWTGVMVRHAVDLNEYVPKSELDVHFPELIRNSTADGKLVGLPWSSDSGLLYYRTDLLDKYGFDNPPRTWNELEQMAETIQEGERAEGNNNFWGFVWQGNSYEGLTCNALEWQASHDGGSIISPDGTITVNNPATIAAFEQAAGWVGTISPPEVTSYQEEDARGVWQSGNAAFMRNWPYAYNLGQYETSSRVKDKFTITSLPAALEGQNAAAFGGGQLMVSKYSNNVEAATLFARYMTSYKAQKDSASNLSRMPTIPSIYSDPDVLSVQPVMAQMLDAYESAVARPSTVTGDLYSQVSSAYFDTVHDILTGAVTASEGVESLEQDLVQITGFPTGSP